MDNSELYKLWDEFLVSWPVERVRNMTLEEYTEAGNPDVFIHWVEFRTKPLATISSGSSFLFGIFSRKDQSPKNNTEQYIYEDQYAWRKAYGKTKEEAFNTVKQYILDTVDFIQQGNLEAIDALDFSPVFKWKIAFLYQNRQNIKIVPTFAEQRLRFLTGVDLKAKDFKIEAAYAKLLDEKGDKELFEYNRELTQNYIDAHLKEKFNTQIAYDYMHERYPTFEKTAEYLFCIENKFGLELALETTNFDKPSPRLFLKSIPPQHIQGLQVSSIAKGKSPNSNLGSTKTLKREHEFVKVTITNMQQLEALCNWWDELKESNQDSSKKLTDEISKMEVKEQSLNRILFGAAGTGKTYHTINHALSIIENKPLEVLEQEDRTALKNRFDQYKEQGQIKFVTFHQSFSYEDFVEGIRAETENGILTFGESDGIFKLICVAALKKDKLLHDANSIGELINNFINEVKVNPIILNTKEGKKIDVYTNERNTLMVRNSVNSEKSLRIKYISDYLLNYSDQIVLRTSYEWAVATFLLPRLKELVSKPYVLIIDEINRGNISRIFGELITLIEDSKRQGAEEELSVTLPYSKEEFSVPSNVYIIGTMNSSDRSLTGLDIALRRRFTFVEMPPKPELLNDVEVDGLNVGELLKVINQRIEVLLDRDHCIGHANFMCLKKTATLKELASIFQQKIIPQLQEYFFDDWAKINMVLNANGMLKAQTVERSVLFPNVDTESEGIFEDQKTWQIVETAFDSIDSFTKISKH